MASTSSSRSEKIVLQVSDGIIFEVDKAVANLASRGLILLPKVPSNILAKVIEYCKRVITQQLTSGNNIDLKAFVSELVNDDEKTLFGLLVAADYLDINGLLSFTCEDVLDMIKCKIWSTYEGFSISRQIFPRKRRKICEGRIPGLSTKWEEPFIFL
ncbi:hypothetical protein M9H77_21208 [Catharanthus roseus]|uniref:Uncharacterized protein n=1 Tax=Catharanthus roseus TaxID=4058 RepID=A0ACC0ALX3_CATRO|nr:hypothetical protein M9H77_21208 [Catharanthus roseus]